MLVKNVNPNQLQNEFTANNIATISLVNDRKDGYIAENTWVEFAKDTDMGLVQQIIDAHDPTPLPPVPSEIEILKMEQAKANAEMINLMMSILGGAM